MNHEKTWTIAFRRFVAFARNQRGNVAVIFGLVLIPLMGTLALGTEVAGWLVEHRAEQNAADSAAIAAAAEGGDGTGNYATVGLDVATQDGFTSGGANGLTTTVAVAADTSLGLCTSSTPCFKVTITRNVPVSLTAVVGYTGTNGTGQQNIVASAIAVAKPIQGPFCIVALATISVSSPGNVTCNAFSVGGMTCNGPATFGVADTEATFSNASTCGSTNQFGNQPAPANLNPFASYGSFVPSNTCSSYYPASSAQNNNVLKGDPGWDGTTHVVCGDLPISGTVTLSSSSPTTIVIENGNLVLSPGSALQATGSGGLTIVFSGTAGNQYTSGGSPTNFVTGTGTLDVAAPLSGNWNGVAIYQDTALPVQNATLQGTFEISGAIVATRANLLASGNESFAGNSCFTLIANALTLNGLNLQVGAQSQCPQTQQLLALTGYTGQLVE